MDTSYAALELYFDIPILAIHKQFFALFLSKLRAELTSRCLSRYFR
jgi:hypothetical protein